MVDSLGYISVAYSMGLISTALS